MELHISTHTFKTDGGWETVDTYWDSPFSYWRRNGVRVTPPMPLRIVVWGALVEESDEAWTRCRSSALAPQPRATKGRVVFADGRDQGSRRSDQATRRTDQPLFSFFNLPSDRIMLREPLRD